MVQFYVLNTIIEDTRAMHKKKTVLYCEKEFQHWTRLPGLIFYYM